MVNDICGIIKSGSAISSGMPDTVVSLSPTAGGITVYGSGPNSYYGEWNSIDQKPSITPSITIDGGITVQCMPGMNGGKILDFDIYLSIFQFSDQFLRSLVKEKTIVFSWKALCHGQDLTEDFIADYADKVDWKEISRSQSLNFHELKRFKDRLDWGEVSKSQILSAKELSYFSDVIDVNSVLWNDFAEVTYKFVDGNSDRIISHGWDGLSHGKSMMTDGAVLRYGDKPGFDVRYVSEHVRLSEKTILRFISSVDFISGPNAPACRKYRSRDIRCYLILTGHAN
jgi:hypothetical protein